MSDSVWSDIGEGASDVGRSAAHGPGEAWWAAMQNSSPASSHLTGDMERTTETDSQVGPPESYQSALLKHAAAEGAEQEAEHWRQYATRDPGAGGGTSAPDIEPAVSGWERYSAGFNAAPEAAQGHYGVGPSASTTEQEAGAHEPEL